MKKSIYLAALAALTLTACSNQTDEVFDQSAAERLEQYKKEYADVLTADGGLWSMEYFSNPDEPGYVFVMKFDKNGSVEISANHQWIGSEFKQETSLWKMIADNGPVLSFNSYNTLFHIFSDPANIVGPNAPTGDEGDINETGYGHEGDYEFQVMEVSEDRQTVRLLGKKRMYAIFLHRLDPMTDVAAFLEESTGKTGFISPYFDYLNMVAEDGEEFILTEFASGIPSVYPKKGDAVTQTRSANGIFTKDGFRFMKEFEVPRAAGSDPLKVTAFTFQEDGSLLSSDGTRIIGPHPYDVFMKETVDYSWYLDMEACSGAFADYLSALTAGIKEAYPSRSLESIYFAHEVFDGKLYPSLNVKISGAKAATYYLEFASASEDGISFKVVDANSQAGTFAKKTQALRDFADSVAKHTIAVSSENLMAPEVLDAADVQNSANKMVVKVG